MVAAARHCGRWETLAVLFMLSFIPAFATPPTAVPIHSGWRLHALNDNGHPGVEQWHPAEVPRLVQMDLLRNKLIPDPFYRDNEKSLQWIGLTDWEYQTEFDVVAATLARGHVDLLDTYADVYLNDAELLKAGNMLRSLRLAVKDRLHAGKKTLRIVFDSSVMLTMRELKALPYRPARPDLSNPGLKSATSLRIVKGSDGASIAGVCDNRVA